MSTFDEPRPQVVVETANRVVVRLGGAFPGPDGAPISELIIFVEVLAFSPEVKLQPVFIYRGRPREDLVEALTLTVKRPLDAGSARYAFANGQSTGGNVSGGQRSTTSRHSRATP